MVIFLKKKRKTASNDNLHHSRVSAKGHLYVGGIYAGFEDDTFKLIYHPVVRRKAIFRATKVRLKIKQHYMTQ